MAMVKRFDSFMFSHYFTRISYNNCLYLWKLENGSLLYLLLYVDDMLVACDTLFEVENLNALLSSEFDIKDLAEPRNYLDGNNERPV